MRISPVPSEILAGSICSQKGGPDFFSPLPEDVRRAKNWCAPCPVRFECLSWALKNQETYGVWGGADQWEMRAALAMTPHGDPVKTPRRAKCPFCRSVRTVTEVRELTGRASQAHCSQCGLHWRRARSYVKKERSRNRNISRIVPSQELPDAA